MTQVEITVASVSWRSSTFLQDLFANLLTLANQPKGICFLVADNTGGDDAGLARLEFPRLGIMPVQVNRERMSIAHAIGLNTLIQHVGTPYVLITDPDVVVFQRGWDTILREALAERSIVAIGAPYPPWKLGKYHDFPSPPFAFWNTESLLASGANWQPYARSVSGRLKDFAWRQAFWLPRLWDHRVRRFPPRQPMLGRYVERLAGIVSKDTGWEIADYARRYGWQAEVFSVARTPDDLTALRIEDREPYRALIDEFELYVRNGQPFVAHLQSTQMGFNINLWTRHYLYRYENREKKLRQVARWRELTTTLLNSQV